MSDEILMQEIEKLKQENARLLREWHKADLAKNKNKKGENQKSLHTVI